MLECLSAHVTPTAYRPTRWTSVGSSGLGWPRMGRLILIAMPSGRRRAQLTPGQEIVDRHVLVRSPGGSAPPDRRLLEGPPAIVEVLERAPDREITRRADVAPAEVAREEPFGGPAAEAAHGGERLDDVLVGAVSERAEIELARGDLAREAHDVLRLARRELHPAQLAQPRPCQPLRLGKTVDGVPGHLDRRAEAAHESRPDHEREGQVDLLGAHRADQHLEGLGGERGSQPPEARHERSQHRVFRGDPIEPVHIEPEAADARDLGCRRIEHARAAPSRRGHDESDAIDASRPPHLVAAPATGYLDGATEDARRQSVDGILAEKVEALERARDVETAINRNLGLHGGLSVYQSRPWETRRHGSVTDVEIGRAGRDRQIVPERLDDEVEFDQIRCEGAEHGAGGGIGGQ